MQRSSFAGSGPNFHLPHSAIQFMRACNSDFYYGKAQYFFGVAKRPNPGSQIRMRNLIVPLFYAAALTASAQTFSFGVKAGAPVTAALPYDSSPYSIVDTGRWTVGPTAEVRLFGHLSFEADALFRGYRSQSSGGFILAGTSLVSLQTAPVSAFFRQNTKEWDFPLLLKYRFQAGTMHPFVNAGFEFAHASSDFTIRCFAGPDICSAAGIGSSVTSQNRYSSSVNRQGPAAGVGMEFKFGKVKISPEVRYTQLTRPNANEVTVLAAFTF
jgi:hypothetical protein